MNCRCKTAPCSCSPSTTSTSSFCDPTPTAPPVPDTTIPLVCTILGDLQDIVDDARMLAADIVGTDAYEVRLVWQEQDQVTGKWDRVYERAINPCSVRESRENLEALAAGQTPTGGVTLREISPLYFDEDLLKGYIDGQQWTGATREFFYEIQRKRRCATSREPERYRYSLSSVPEYRPTRFDYTVRLTAQLGRRERDGTDSTVPGDYFPPLDGASLIG
jgi:hypothetical protein